MHKPLPHHIESLFNLSLVWYLGHVILAVKIFEFGITTYVIASNSKYSIKSQFVLCYSNRTFSDCISAMMKFGVVCKLRIYVLVMHRYQFLPTDPIPILFTHKWLIAIWYWYLVHIIVCKQYRACYIFSMNYKAFTFGTHPLLIDVLNWCYYLQ